MVPPRDSSVDDAEDRRILAMHSLGLLTGEDDPAMTAAVAAAAELFKAEGAAIAVVDRDDLVFRSAIGIDVATAPRDGSVCGHTIQRDGPLVVDDALADQRFAHLPPVQGPPHLRFYAGLPLRSPSGYNVATLFVEDPQPRTTDPSSIEIFRQIGRLLEQVLAARDLATYDELTGLKNRRGLIAAGDYLLAIADRHTEPVSIVFIDVDGLKTINDRLGHAEGDRLLVALAGHMQHTFRAADVVARVGGDEFVALLTGTRAKGAGTAIGRLEQRIAASSDGPLIRISAGHVDREPGGSAMVDLVARADAEMYDRRSAARATVVPSTDG